ncbi:MAG TPA: ABC-F family ATP-binding cassette domain-containing protein [Longimicrobiales bacterium]|nr:ABC-F family ATP-binding cassette domain-containing protein [Longimicrobiales bacterium]
MAHRHDIIISVERLAFELPDGRRLLSDTTFGFGHERTGLVGANGAGKTTFARILTGELRPSSGVVVRHGRIGYLPQHRIEAALVERTGAARRPGQPAPPRDGSPPTVAHLLGIAEPLAAMERVLAGIADPADLDRIADRWDIGERAAAALARVGLPGLPLDRPAGSLSGGEATRAALAALILDETDFLILDEPTNDLDAPSRAALYDFVESWTSGMLVITHDRALLGRVDRILELSALGARMYGGAYPLYRSQKEAEDAAAGEDLAHARRELRRARRAAQAARERQERRSAHARKAAAASNMPKILLGVRKRAGQATAGRLREIGEKRIAVASDRLADAKARVEERERIDLALPSTGLHATRRVVEANELRFAWGDATPVIDALSFRITGPARVAVVGPNGSGKTTLLRLITGELVPTGGRLDLGIPRPEVAYLDQHARRLDPELSVLENFRRANPSLEPTAARYTLARYLFRADAALAPVRTLSGGERMRAALACTLNALRPPKLVLLDEPTNHLDLESLEAVEGILSGYDGALVVVSHDPMFLDAIGIDERIELG